MTGPEDQVKAVLDEMGIPFSRREHPPVATVEEAEKYWGGLRGAHCKNLFLRNNKGNRHFLVIAEASRKIDLKSLARALGQDRLSFASAERLRKYLGLDGGSVSPFGLINDADREVRVVIDAGLRNAGTVNFHPNINTATLGLSFPDFEKFLARCGNKVEYLDL
jgi:Ala-tRNA(Pro) deacylase